MVRVAANRKTTLLSFHTGKRPLGKAAVDLQLSSPADGRQVLGNKIPPDFNFPDSQDLVPHDIANHQSLWVLLGPEDLMFIKRTENKMSTEGKKSPKLQQKQQFYTGSSIHCSSHLNQNKTYVWLQKQLVFRQVFYTGVDFISY